MTQGITADWLKKLLDYDLLTGDFKWLSGRGGVARGSVAGSVNNDGYVMIKIGGKTHCAHRLAFLFVLNYLPPNEVDHINGIRADNRWMNLRPTTRTENGRNQRRSHNNTSGITGISSNYTRKDGTQLWIAKIGCGGRKTHKYFSTKEAAIEWRKEKELELNYHKNHGNVLRGEI